jgi:hypothetical protein
MIRALIAGPDRGIATELAAQDVETVRLNGLATGAALDEAEIGTASFLFITDVEEATAVSIAKDRNPDVRVVFYTPDAVPEFVKGQLDLAVDPALLDPDVVVEELVATVEE